MNIDSSSPEDKQNSSTSSRLTPDLAQLKEHLDRLYRYAGDDGYLSFRCFTDRGNTDKKPLFRTLWTNHRGKTGDRPAAEVSEQLARQCAEQPEPAIFCPPLAVFNNPDSFGATEADVLRGLTISVDCDSKPNEGRRILEGLLGPATEVVASGGLWINGDSVAEEKLHMHWRLRTPAEGEKALKRLKEVRRVLTKMVDGDATCVPVEHCFRIPGSVHMRAEHRLCRIVDGDQNVEVDLDEVFDLLKAHVKEKPRHDGNGFDQNFVGLDELIRAMHSGEALHVSVTKIAGKMARAAVPRWTCIDIVKGVFDSAGQERYEGRWPECERTVNDIYDKEESKPKENAGELPPDIVMNDFYAYLPKHWYLYVPTQTLWPPATINSRLPKVDKLKATRHLDRFRAISQMVWAPGREQIVRDEHLIEGGWDPKPGAIIFNQYRQPRLFGGDPRAAGPWLDLFRKLYPNPFEHEHMIKVLAYKLQHPEKKINHAIVLGGGMRIGKDTLLLPIKRAFGSWNCYEAKPATIMGNFNGYMRSVLLTINETRDLGDVKKYQFYDHMKDVIVSPPETVLLNDKYEKGVHVTNVCLVIMTTNHRTDGIYLPPGDGRHFPVWSDVQKEDYNPDYFIGFYRWLNHGGDAHVAAYLRSLDVGDFDPGLPPPLTDLFHEIVEASEPLEHGWLTDLIALMGDPPTLTIDELISKISTIMTPDWDEPREWLENRGNAKTIPYRLDECGYVRVRNPSVANGRWTIDGRKINVYGRKDLTAKQRLDEAQKR